jgi:hypothetical protein
VFILLTVYQARILDSSQKILRRQCTFGFSTIGHWAIAAPTAGGLARHTAYPIRTLPLSSQTRKRETYNSIPAALSVKHRCLRGQSYQSLPFLQMPILAPDDGKPILVLPGFWWVETPGQSHLEPRRESVADEIVNG